MTTTNLHQQKNGLRPAPLPSQLYLSPKLMWQELGRQPALHAYAQGLADELLSLEQDLRQSTFTLGERVLKTGTVDQGLTETLRTRQAKIGTLRGQLSVLALTLGSGLCEQGLPSAQDTGTLIDDLLKDARDRARTE